jgi:hypothetical protein
VYVDGPLLGQDFPTDSPAVQAVDYGTGSPADGLLLGTHEIVTYQFREFGFHMGGTAVMLWIGWCGPEPDAAKIAQAVLKDDVMGRAEVRPVEVRALYDPPGEHWPDAYDSGHP